MIILMASVALGLLTDGNLLYYSFDVADTTSTVMIDSSASGYNGTCAGMASDCNTLTGKLLNASDYAGCRRS